MGTIQQLWQARPIKERKVNEGISGGMGEPGNDMLNLLKAQQLITCMVNILGLRFQQTYTVVHFMQKCRIYKHLMHKNIVFCERKEKHWKLLNDSTR